MKFLKSFLLTLLCSLVALSVTPLTFSTTIGSVTIDDVIFREQIPVNKGRLIAEKASDHHVSTPTRCLIIIRNLNPNQNITSARIDNQKRGKLYIHLNSDAEGSSSIRLNSIEKTERSLKFQNQAHRVHITITPLYPHGIPHKNAPKVENYKIKIKTNGAGKSKTCKGEVSERQIRQNH